MVDLLARARIDIQRITQGEFSTSITVEKPDLSSAIVVKGLAMKHHMSFDLNSGDAVNSKQAHISISEQLFVDASFTIRDGNGEVDLKGYFITYTDSTGNSQKYVVNEYFPDETVGLIVMTLGEFQ